MTIPELARFSRTALLTGLLALLAACQSGPEPTFFEENPIDAGVYDYSLDSPFASTVVGTPVAMRADLPRGYPKRELKLQVFPTRPVPEIFWYAERLRVTAALQDGPAPLVFSIGGTGADDQSQTMRVIEALLYGHGFHVISIASPTHPNFVIGGSLTSVPGRVDEDVTDLYRVMRLAYEELAPEIQVTDFHLTGYSLGGWHAAFLTAFDEDQKGFDFKRVLLINPPESLYESISILDRMLEESIPGGMEGVNEFFQEAFESFSKLYTQTEFVEFDEDFLYQAYGQLNPGDEKLGALIGLAFRFSANSMIFAADVMQGGGYIVPSNAVLTRSTSLTPFFKTGARTGFVDYLDKFYGPFFLARNPEITQEDLVAEASLKRISDYLSANRKIGLIHNRDDLILGPDDIEFFEETFGERALIFPNGGHMGNLQHRFVMAAIADFFQGRPLAREVTQ